MGEHAATVRWQPNADADFLRSRYSRAHEWRLDGGAIVQEWIAEVLLRPRVAFGGDPQPDAAAIEALHHKAHAECFIASSVKSAIRIEPRA